MESEACRIDGGTCLPGEDEVRTAMRAAIAQAIGSGERIERDVALGGRDYRLLVHQMPPALGRRYLVAAAVPIVELSVDFADPAGAGRPRRGRRRGVGHPRRAARLVHAVAIDLAHRGQDRTHPRPRFLRPHAGREPHHRDHATVRFGRAHARGAGGVRPLRVEEPRAADHALARDCRRRRPAARDHGDVHRHRRLLADRRDHGAGAADQPAVALLRCAGIGDPGQPRHHRQVHRRQHHGLLERAGAGCRPHRQCLPRRPAGRHRRPRSFPRNGASSAGRAFARALACIPAWRWSAMSARASTSTTRWSVRWRTRRPGWKA